MNAKSYALKHGTCKCGHQMPRIIQVATEPESALAPVLGLDLLFECPMCKRRGNMTITLRKTEETP